MTSKNEPSPESVGIHKIGPSASPPVERTKEEYETEGPEGVDQRVERIEYPADGISEAVNPDQQDVVPPIPHQEQPK